MNPYQTAVEAFHRGTGQEVGETPALRDNELRAKLILEEAVETAAALGFEAFAELRDYSGQIAEFSRDYDTGNIVDTIDGLCDLLYVTFGTAVAMGVDLDPFFAEVQRANMEKLQGPKRADGKQLKPDGWRPPNHLPILEKLEQGESHQHSACCRNC